MNKYLHISRFTTRLLLLWCLFLAATLIVLAATHQLGANVIAFHALTLDGFLASLLMGLRVIVLFLVFSTLPMRWPVTLLTFLSLTIAMVALSQVISVILQGHLLVSLAYVLFVGAFCAFLFTAIYLVSETINGNTWGDADQQSKSYLLCWLKSLLATLRRLSLPLLVSLLLFSVLLPLTNHVTF